MNDNFPRFYIFIVWSSHVLSQHSFALDCVIAHSFLAKIWPWTQLEAQPRCKSQWIPTNVRMWMVKIYQDIAVRILITQQHKTLCYGTVNMCQTTSYCPIRCTMCSNFKALHFYFYFTLLLFAFDFLKRKLQEDEQMSMYMQKEQVSVWIGMWSGIYTSWNKNRIESKNDEMFFDQQTLKPVSRWNLFIGNFNGTFSMCINAL